MEFTSRSGSRLVTGYLVIKLLSGVMTPQYIIPTAQITLDLSGLRKQENFNQKLSCSCKNFHHKPVTTKFQQE
jgi:hypothetical protein